MARNDFYLLSCILFVFALSVFSAADTVSVDKCGHLNTVQPTILGRNVTFTFTPSLYNTNTTFRWERTNTNNPWANLPQNKKFVQFEKNGTFYLILTNTIAKDDEVYYRIKYDNATVKCTMESQRLTLKDISGETCGFIYLRTAEIEYGKNVEIEFYPTVTITNHPSNNTWVWVGSTSQSIVDLTSFFEGLYEEKVMPNNKYVLTIFSYNSSMNGNYSVWCSARRSYSTSVKVVLPVAPHAPVFENLTNIDNCLNCIVGEDGDKFSVICRITGGTEPITVTMAIGNRSLNVVRDNENGGYAAFFNLYNSIHMTHIICSVKNDALTAPLTVKAPMYIIKQPNRNSFAVPETITEGDPINITCTFASGRPAPTLSLEVSDTKLSDVHQTNTFDEVNQTYTSVVSLNTFKKIWNNQNFSCCRQNEWYNDKNECLRSERLAYLFAPVTEFNISGSVLEILTGTEVYVKCTARSNPKSNISWIEHSASGDVTRRKLKQCDQNTECVLAIQGERIMDKYIFCNSENVLGADLKNLTLNIVEKKTEPAQNLERTTGLDNEEKTEPSHDLERTTGLNNGTYWIPLGSALAVIAVIITIGVIVGIKKRNSEKGNLAASYNAVEDSSRHNDLNINSDVGEASSRPGNLYCGINNVCGEMSCENVTYAVVNKTRQVHAGANFSTSQLEGQVLHANPVFDRPGSDSIKGTVVKRRDSPTEYVGIDFVKTAEKCAREEGANDTENVYTNQ